MHFKNIKMERKLLKGNSKMYVKLLKALHFGYENRVAQFLIDSNKSVLQRL